MDRDRACGRAGDAPYVGYVPSILMARDQKIKTGCSKAVIERRHFRLHIRGDREPRSGEDSSGSAAGLSETGTSFRAKAGAFGGCDPMGMTSRRARRRPESQTDVHQQRHHGIARNQRTTHSRHPAFRPRDFAQHVQCAKPVGPVRSVRDARRILRTFGLVSRRVLAILLPVVRIEKPK